MARYTLDNVPVDKDKYKVIALDLDDTLLNSEKRISKANKEALQKAQSQGYAIAIATGRHPNSAVRYMDELGCLNENSYAVCFNGSGVVRLSDYIRHNNQVGYPMVSSHTTGADMIKKLTAFAHENGCKVHAYSKISGLLIEDHNPHTQREIEHGQVGFTEVDFMHLDDSEIFFKCLIVGEEQELNALREKIPSEFTDVFSVVRSDANFLEFIPDHCTKGSALCDLCKALGYEIENAIAFGDAENDLAMIKSAGLGVAMANGYQMVKDAADVVTLTNDEDGVAALVNKFLK